jgi:hypothetical protein
MAHPVYLFRPQDGAAAMADKIRRVRLENRPASVGNPVPCGRTQERSQQGLVRSAAFIAAR